MLECGKLVAVPVGEQYVHRDLPAGEHALNRWVRAAAGDEDELSLISPPEVSRRDASAPLYPGAFGPDVRQSIEAPFGELVLDSRAERAVAPAAGSCLDPPADCPMGDVLVAIWSRHQADWAPVELAVADLGDDLRLDDLHVLCGTMPNVELLPNAVLLRLDP